MSWVDHGKRPGPKPKRTTKGRRPCTFPGCGRDNFARGLCAGHNKQKSLGIELRPIREPRPEPADGMLWCGKCKQFRDETEFGWDKSRDQPRRTCRPCHAAKMLDYRNSNLETINLRARLAKRGLTPAAYGALLEKQAGLCAICGTGGRLDIDHCHQEGHVRGLLCAPCNKGLGNFRDDPELLAAAARYLGS